MDGHPVFLLVVFVSKWMCSVRIHKYAIIPMRAYLIKDNYRSYIHVILKHHDGNMSGDANLVMSWGSPVEFSARWHEVIRCASLSPSGLFGHIPVKR